MILVDGNLFLVGILGDTIVGVYDSTVITSITDKYPSPYIKELNKKALF